MKTRIITSIVGLAVLALVLACIAFAAMVTKGDVTLTLVFTGRP